jgi:hypothetical protein
MNKKSDIEELIYNETEKRLTEMKNQNYVFPQRIGIKDILGIVSLIVICLCLIVLCMMGVIE